MPQSASTPWFEDELVLHFISQDQGIPEQLAAIRTLEDNVDDGIAVVLNPPALPVGGSSDSNDTCCRPRLQRFVGVQVALIVLRSQHISLLPEWTTRWTKPRSPEPSTTGGGLASRMTSAMSWLVGKSKTATSTVSTGPPSTKTAIERELDLIASLFSLVKEETCARHGILQDYTRTSFAAFRDGWEKERLQITCNESSCWMAICTSMCAARDRQYRPPLRIAVLGQPPPRTLWGGFPYRAFQKQSRWVTWKGLRLQRFDVEVEDYQMATRDLPEHIVKQLLGDPPYNLWFRLIYEGRDITNNGDVVEKTFSKQRDAGGLEGGSDGEEEEIAVFMVKRSNIYCPPGVVSGWLPDFGYDCHPDRWKVQAVTRSDFWFGDRQFTVDDDFVYSLLEGNDKSIPQRWQSDGNAALPKDFLPQELDPMDTDCGLCQWQLRCATPAANITWTPENDHMWPMVMRKIVRYLHRIQIPSACADHASFLPHDVVCVIAEYL